ncbi:MAG: hypothetical protein ACRBCK_10720 [Alphaproteobacteria bacterium]
MAFLITGIFSIDRKLIEFTENEDGTGAVMHPSYAYEILIEIDGKKFETDGVVWDVDEQELTCFVGEEFEDMLMNEYSEKFTEQCRLKISEFIAHKYTGHEIELPYVIWE